MRYKSLPTEFYTKKRAELLKMIKPKSLVIVNSNDEMPRNGDQTFPYRQNSDFFYLTGLDQEKCILTLCPEHPVESMREILFTVKTNEHMVTWYGFKYTFEEAKQLSGIATIKWLDEFEITLKDLMSRVNTVYLNQNEYTKFTTEVLSRDLRFAQKMKADFPMHNPERLAPLVTELRMVKDKVEIEQMQRACDITGDAFRRVLGFVKPGVLEYEIEAEISHEFIRKGCSGHSYPPIIASGANACILHYVNNDRVCADGDLVLMDFGAEYGLYAADLSRTIPVNGKFNPRQREVYEAVLRLLKFGMNTCTPGKNIDVWHKGVTQMMEKELLGLGLITQEDIAKQTDAAPAYFKYYMHGTGHFLGLDVHDVGSRQDIFKEGMVITVEPGIYIPEEGIGIRLENDVMIAENPVNLMASIPVEPEEIEALMLNK
jgi:Xaa-Pro aminopeptidase